MARNELARILGAEPALERGFEQIAGLRGDRKAERHKDEHWGDSKSRELHHDERRRDAAERAADARRTRSSSG